MPFRRNLLSQCMRIHNAVPTPALTLCSRLCSSSASSTFTSASAAPGTPPKTGIMMLNMGGPADPADTKPFLMNLFSDPDIIPMGGGMAQQQLAKLIVRRRGDRVEQQYREIGGSPITKWTETQMMRMCDTLDRERPESAPHKAYVSFRYVRPSTEDALVSMREDGVRHAIAFSQYPQWCCSTSGSSMNHLWRELKRLGMMGQFEWSVIDRWYSHSGYISSLTDRILETVKSEQITDFSQVLILFSAHSVPIKSVTKGDPYITEVCTTVKLVMKELLSRLDRGGQAVSHQLCWQSKVGYLPWMTPSTEEVLKAVGKHGRQKTVLVVPFVFTSDHIETLYELDVEYAEVAKESGIEKYIRVPALNDCPTFVRALSDIVKEHLDGGQAHSNDYHLRCHGCRNEQCRKICNPKYPAEKIAKVLE